MAINQKLGLEAMKLQPQWKTHNTHQAVEPSLMQESITMGMTFNVLGPEATKLRPQWKTRNTHQAMATKSYAGQNEAWQPE